MPVSTKFVVYTEDKPTQLFHWQHQTVSGNSLKIISECKVWFLYLLAINALKKLKQCFSPHLLKEMSSCSGCWVVGWRTHFPLSISTRTSSSKSMFLSVAGPLKLRLVAVLGQRSLNSWLTAENPDDFLWDGWLTKQCNNTVKSDSWKLWRLF